MNTLAKIALRNLNRQKKRSSLIGGAIAFGILIVTIINGFAGAFQKNVAENMAQLFAGHVFIQGVEKTPKGKVVEIIRDDSAILAAIKDAKIDTSHASRRSGTQTTLVFQGKKALQAINGVDLENELFLKERLIFKQGGWDKLDNPHALIISEGVAKKLKVEIGDRIQAQLKTATGQNNVGEFVLAGVSQDMGLFSGQVAYAHRAYINKLINIGQDEYQMFGILTKDLAKAEKTADHLLAALKKHATVFELSPADLAKKADSSGHSSRYSKLLKLAKKDSWTGTKFRVFTINDMVSQIEEMVNILNLISTIVLTVLFLIIMVGIYNTFRMIMYERVKEIGTMRAMGTQRWEVRNLFLLEASFLSLTGIASGTALAGIVMFFLSLIDFGTDSMFSIFLKGGHLSFTLQPFQTILNIALVLGFTILAASLPARKASRLEPAVALRSAN